MLNRLPPRLSPRFSVPYLAVLSGIWLAPSAVYADDASYSLSLNAWHRAIRAASSTP